MAEDSGNPSGRNRRSSFAGETFANIFGTGRSNSVSKRGTSASNAMDAASQPTQQYPGPITTAAAQAQRRRLSLTTLGLSGSPNQTSPFNSYRRDSNASGSIDESAIEDDVGAPAAPASSQPNPFGRRVSFGAKALRDVRNSGGGSTSGGGGEQNEGFNWSDNFRTRAERTSIAVASSTSSSTTNSPPNGSSHMGGYHNRAKSVATMEAPFKDMPVKAKEQIRPDHFQERILKGDFYMD